jgi:hypothetical protein
VALLGDALGWLKGPGRRRAWRRRVVRKVVAAGCAVAAVVGVLGTARSNGEVATAPVLVAARSLGAGAVLRAGDVRVARWPAEAVRGRWAMGSARPAVGRLLAGPLAAGEPVTAGRLLGPSLLEGQTPGTVAVHVPLSDPAAAALARPGERVDLLAAGGTALARHALVLAGDPVPSGAAGGGWGASGLGAPGVAPGSARVILAVDGEEAPRLAAHLAAGLEATPMTVVLRPR